MSTSGLRAGSRLRLVRDYKERPYLKSKQQGIFHSKSVQWNR